MVTICQMLMKDYVILVFLSCFKLRWWNLTLGKREANLEKGRRGGCVFKDGYPGRTLSCVRIGEVCRGGLLGFHKAPWVSHTYGRTDSKWRRESVPPHQRSSQACVFHGQSIHWKSQGLGSYLYFSFSLDLSLACLIYPTFLSFSTLQIGKLGFKILTPLYVHTPKQ